MIYDFVMILP